MKKALVFMLLALVAISGLFASGSSENSKSLVVWYERSFSDDANVVIEDRFKQYADENDVDLEYEMIVATDLMQKLNAGIEAGNVPDLVILNKYKVLSYGENNPFLDVTDLVNEIDTQRSIIDAAKDATKIGGRNYYVPFYSQNTLTFMRADKIKEAGLEIPVTYDEVFAAAEAISDPANGFYGLGWGCGPIDEDGCNMFRQVVWAKGGGLYAEDGTITANTDPIVLEVVEKYKELYDKNVIPPAAVSWGSSGNNQSYLMGESGIVFNTATLYNAMKNDPNYADLLANTVITALPSDVAGSIGLNLCVGWGIPKDAKNVETAMDFIKYMFDTEWYNSFFELVAPVFAPIFVDSADDPLFSEGVNAAAYEYAVNANGYYGYPVATPEGEILAATHYYQFPVVKMLNNVVVQGMDPQAALDALAKETADLRDNLFN